jgi:hypothetical protein
MSACESTLSDVKTAAVAISALVALALAGCAVDGQIGASPTPAPEPFATSGTISVPMDFAAMLQRADADNPPPCIAKAGYSDIVGGAQVIVANGSGETVAVGALDDGVIADNQSSTGDAKVCEFSFTASDIPPGSKFYSVHIGNTNRGEQTYTAAQLRDGIALSIG